MHQRLRFTQLSQALLTEIRRRQRNGEISVAALAAETCLSQPHITNILAGRRNLTIQTADAILLGLGLATEDLLRIALDNQPPPPPQPPPRPRGPARFR